MYRQGAHAHASGSAQSHSKLQEQQKRKTTLMQQHAAEFDTENKKMEGSTTNDGATKALTLTLTVAP